MNIVDATKGFEDWLSGHAVLIKDDLKLKHDEMRADAFPFLRATYYRWAQTWAKVCPDCARGPKALSVGDLHVANFGTWRDAEGRLVWGINDFDECYPLPWANDLLRLAVSANLAIATGELAVTPKPASAAILEGYRACLGAGGKPFVLEDNSTPLREMARDRLDTPKRFWDKQHRFPPEKTPVPPGALAGIKEILPDQGVKLRFLHRVAGLGSLGKQRFTAIGTWLGGLIAREAKVITPSACIWAAGGDGGPTNYDKILRRSIRCPDPMVRVREPWLIRRLSPDCFRIELVDLPKKRDEDELLYSMGWETANVHLGTRKAAEIEADLKRRPAGWLHKATKLMRDQTLSDWKDWRKHG